MIPEEKNAVVARALQETFGVTEFEEALRIVSDQHSCPDVMHRLLPLPQ
jgi:hypothetical protein